MAGDSDVLASILAAAGDAAIGEGLPPAAAKRIGIAICESLQRDYGTSRVYIPARSTAARDRAILAAVGAGEQKTLIAARIGVHVSTVERVARRYFGQPSGIG